MNTLKVFCFLDFKKIVFAESHNVSLYWSEARERGGELLTMTSAWSSCLAAPNSINWHSQSAGAWTRGPPLATLWWWDGGRPIRTSLPRQRVGHIQTINSNWRSVVFFLHSSRKGVDETLWYDEISLYCSNLKRMTILLHLIPHLSRFLRLTWIHVWRVSLWLLASCAQVVRRARTHALGTLGAGSSFKTPGTWPFTYFGFWCLVRSP